MLLGTDTICWVVVIWETEPLDTNENVTFLLLQLRFQRMSTM